MDSTLTSASGKDGRSGRQPTTTSGAAPTGRRPCWTWSCDGLGLTPASTVLDVAAGTGKLTRLLAARFTRTIAVEPLEPMRRVLAAEVPGVEVRDGTAEQLPVGEAEVDAIFVAEAFHWFDGAQALAEAARVLRPAVGSRCCGTARRSLGAGAARVGPASDPGGRRRRW